MFKNLLRSEKLCTANFKLFQLYQIWPVGQNDRTFPLRVSMICIIMGYGFFLVYYSAGYCIWTRKCVIPRLMESVSNLLAATSGLLFAYELIIRHPQISAMIDKLSNFDRFGKPEKSDQTEEFLSRGVYSILGLVNCTILLYFVYEPVLMKKECERENAEHNFKRTCGMAIATWLPYDAKDNAAYYVTAFLLCMGILIVIGNTTNFNTLMFTTVESVLPRIEDLKVMLNETFLKQDPKIQRKCFNICIEYHQEVIELVFELNRILQKDYFVHIVLTTLNFTSLLTVCLIEMSVRIAANAILWMMVILILCVSGQRLIDQSEAITDAIYNTNWYDAQIDIQKDLYFMILRSQKLMHLNAMGFGMISHITFQNIMSKAYSLLNLLNRVL